jgi:hypothetical protein
MLGMLLNFMFNGHRASRSYSGFYMVQSWNRQYRMRSRVHRLRQQTSHPAPVAPLAVLPIRQRTILKSICRNDSDISDGLR